MSLHRIQEKLLKRNSNTLFSIPFALLIGPQRAGTSWVHRYLRSRGDICLPEEVKEIFFFDRNYERGSDFYRSHFNLQNQHTLAMEITATSFDCKESPARINETFSKDIRLVCPLRHPIVRSYSLYLHYLRYGIVRGSLQEAVEKVPQIIESSRYAEHLKRWFDVFGHENIVFLYQEELEKNQKAFVEKLCHALSIPVISPTEEVSGRYNITTFSKFGFLALTAQTLADILRKYRLYFVINVAKALGIKKLIFGEERQEIDDHKIPKEDWEWLESHIGKEIGALEELLGSPVLCWKDVKKSYLDE